MPAQVNGNYILDIMNGVVRSGRGDDTLCHDFAEAYRPRERTPVQKLCAAIFEDALLVLEGMTKGRRLNPYAGSLRAKRQRELDEDWVWIRNEEPFGFDFCCGLLQLDPDYIRRRLSERKAA